jgi:hypothetical protein
MGNPNDLQYLTKTLTTFVKMCPLEQRTNGSTEKVKYLVLLPNCHENPKKV